MKLKSLKLNYEVGVRPRYADCSHVDSLVVPAFTVEDAIHRAEKLLKSGVHVPELGEKVEYIVKDVIAPGDEIYGIDEKCSCGRPSASVGCSYLIPASPSSPLMNWVAPAEMGVH